ncbi:hypothetical protein D3C80_907230 [compost metagenome]
MQGRAVQPLQHQHPLLARGLQRASMFAAQVVVGLGGAHKARWLAGVAGGGGFQPAFAVVGERGLQVALGDGGKPAKRVIPIPAGDAVAVLAVAQAPLQGMLVVNVILLRVGSVPVFPGQVPLVGVGVGAATVGVVGADHFSTGGAKCEFGFVGGERLWSIFDCGGDLGGLHGQGRLVLVALDVLALVVACRVGVADGA